MLHVFEHADTPKRVYDALNKLGYSLFRPGQEETIMNILSGLINTTYMYYVHIVHDCDMEAIQHVLRH